MYYTEKEEHWTAKDYAAFWQQQIGKTFEYRRRAFTNSDDVVKSVTITGVKYEDGDSVLVYLTENYENGKKSDELVAVEHYDSLSEDTLYNKLVHQMYCYYSHPYYFFIPLKQALKKDGTLKTRTVFKKWNMCCTLY